MGDERGGGAGAKSRKHTYRRGRVVVCGTGRESKSRMGITKSGARGGEGEEDEGVRAM